jgi:hypothetical protein
LLSQSPNYNFRLVEMHFQTYDYLVFYSPIPAQLSAVVQESSFHPNWLSILPMRKVFVLHLATLSLLLFLVAHAYITNFWHFSSVVSLLGNDVILKRQNKQAKNKGSERSLCFFFFFIFLKFLSAFSLF